MLRRAVSLAVSRRSRPDELLLVERSRKLRYFGGFHAFVGGTLDPEDDEVPVAHLDANEAELAAVFVAGARELFEETGLWIAKGSRMPGARDLDASRRALLAGDVLFADLMGRFEHHLDARDLRPLCRITTPPFSPVRFDTWFLRVTVEDDVPVTIWDGELVAGDFVDPGEKLNAWRRGEAHIAPPMIVLLDAWAKGQDGLHERIVEMTEAYHRGKLHRIYFTPGVLLVPLKTPTQPPATHTNTLVIGEERLYVVDPSPVDPEEQARFWDFLAELVAEGRTIEGILLTHYHRDHVGALAETQERFDVPIFAHADCMAELEGVRFGAPLEHGNTLSLGEAPDGTSGWTLTAYHVPGHARGHLAFQESRYGALVAGDLVSTLSSILIDPSDGHLATYLRSLEFLETVTEGAVYPGHGPPVIDGKAVIRKTLDHRRDREAQLLAALTAEPRTTKELLEAIYTDIDPRMFGLAERSLLSGLIKLEEEGRVARSSDGFRLVSA